MAWPAGTAFPKNRNTGYFLDLYKPPSMNRRNVLESITATSGLALMAPSAFAAKKKDKGKLRFSLNTSTISGQKLGIEKYIDIAARAGYDSIEPWIGDLKAYVSNGGSL